MSEIINIDNYLIKKDKIIGLSPIKHYEVPVLNGFKIEIKSKGYGFWVLLEKSNEDILVKRETKKEIEFIYNKLLNEIKK